MKNGLDMLYGKIRDHLDQHSKMDPDQQNKVRALMEETSKSQKTMTSVQDLTNLRKTVIDTTNKAC